MTRLVIFDLDGTLAYENVSFAFSKFLYKNKFLNLPKMLTLVGIKLAQISNMCSIEAVHEAAFSLILKNKPAEQIDNYISLFLKKALPTLFRPHLLACLQEAKSQNDQIWLLSSSPESIVAPIAAYLGIPTMLATQYEIENGIHKSLKRIVTGTVKRAFLDEFMALKPETKIIAYSDSIQDLPLLEGADKVIVVCPDRKLKKIAKMRNWECLK